MKIIFQRNFGRYISGKVLENVEKCFWYLLQKKKNKFPVYFISNFFFITEIFLKFGNKLYILLIMKTIIYLIKIFQQQKT